MRELRSIVTRILVIGVATGVTGTIGAALTSRLLTHALIAEKSSEALSRRYDAREVATCKAHPASWALTIAGNGRAFAYDARTQQPYDPGAPPLRTDLLLKLPSEDAYAVGFARHMLGVVVLLRRQAASPCDLIQLTTDIHPSFIRRVLVGQGLGALCTGLVSCLFALALGLPLARRIRQLEASADKIGVQGSYSPSGARSDGDEIDRLGAALNRADARIQNDAAVMAEQRCALERHLAEVAHDLRTPLTSLQAALERATEGSGIPEMPDLLASALFDVVYLSALTDNLRFASQLRQGWEPHKSRDSVDLRELVEHVAMRAKMLARRRNVTLEMELPETAMVIAVDRVAAEQALTNVVQNAVTYVDGNGHIAIILRAEQGGQFVFDLLDDGPGVPPPQLPKLGHGTFRSDEARQRDPWGRGLGLAITSEVCSRFGWQLSFRAVEPRGLGVRIRGTFGAGA